MIWSYSEYKQHIFNAWFHPLIDILISAQEAQLDALNPAKT